MLPPAVPTGTAGGAPSHVANRTPARLRRAAGTLLDMAARSTYRPEDVPSSRACRRGGSLGVRLLPLRWPPLAHQPRTFPRPLRRRAPGPGIGVLPRGPAVPPPATRGPDANPHRWSPPCFSTSNRLSTTLPSTRSSASSSPASPADSAASSRSPGTQLTRGQALYRRLVASRADGVLRGRANGRERAGKAAPRGDANQV